MEHIIDSFVSNAFNILFGQDGQEDDSLSHYSEDLTDKSSYSFLNDIADVPKDTCLKIKEDDVCDKKIDDEKSSSNGIANENEKNDNEVAFYENVYLTLNRDYEPCSDEEEPVLQDPKTVPMQEVELLTANTSSENVELHQEKKELGSCAMSTSVAGSRKSSLVHRCRIQGARLLSCFRGWWWRRKLPGKRKVPRAPGSIRGLCPLSPDVRRRAASLLDQRHLGSPTPSTSLAWKFNTINESLVNSSRWKELALKKSLNENDEF
ncbi:uncharacterized protein LOC112043597 [Bicyclus anynana]|uniref:Uncharacterized protein LOC112043597 n=1 Tax=Bicyclus anynana TaxID=110368 RepID=A0ABM3LL82_BICAN|nr:uncharacterized protein LOC112043597 [Bicyclus anynana]